MSSKEADPVHLLRGTRNAVKAWCSARSPASHTRSVDEATCSKCLRTALDHYAIRQEESWQQIQRIIDRQAILGAELGW